MDAQTVGFEVQDTARKLALHMGDNCLILSQNLGAWCGHAPELEEDIALANVALDLIGQARMWLDYAGELEGAGRDADALAFRREEREFRNLLLVEQSNGNYADTLMRQFLFDAWHLPMLRALTGSSDTTIAGIAAKSVKEVTYHLNRSVDLIVRLGDGSEQSHEMMQAALDRLVIFVHEMTAWTDDEAAAADAGLVANLADVKSEFEERIGDTFSRATLANAGAETRRTGGKSGLHSEAMGRLLAEMQHIPRSFPDAKW